MTRRLRSGTQSNPVGGARSTGFWRIQLLPRAAILGCNRLALCKLHDRPSNHIILRGASVGHLARAGRQVPIAAGTEDESAADLYALHAVVSNAVEPRRHRRLSVGLALENEHAKPKCCRRQRQAADRVVLLSEDRPV